MIAEWMAVLAIALVTAWTVTAVLIPLLRKIKCVDVPGPRSSHVRTTPRGGGMAVVCGMAAGVLLALLFGLKIPGATMFAGALIVAAVGLTDDLFRDVSVLVRLSAQCTAAGFVAYHAGGLERLPLPPPLDQPLGVFAVPVAVLWIVGITNLYNFLDGIDGFAGLQGAIVGLAIAFLGAGAPVTVVGLALAGACLGFLVHNWHPAKVFMGDVGATTIGFIVAVVPLEMAPGAREHAVFTIALCIWFFLADGVLTILLRLLRGEKIWVAHRCHLYQRLVHTGLPHDRVVLAVLGPGAVVAALAVIAHRFGDTGVRWSVVALAFALFFGYYVWTSARERALRHRVAASRAEPREATLSDV